MGLSNSLVGCLMAESPSPLLGLLWLAPLRAHWSE